MRSRNNTRTEDGAESTNDHRSEVEDSQTFLDLMASVPAGDDKDECREKTCL